MWSAILSVGVGAVVSGFEIGVVDLVEAGRVSYFRDETQSAASAGAASRGSPSSPPTTRTPGSTVTGFSDLASKLLADRAAAGRIPPGQQLQNKVVVQQYRFWVALLALVLANLGTNALFKWFKESGWGPGPGVPGPGAGPT